MTANGRPLRRKKGNDRRHPPSLCVESFKNDFIYDTIGSTNKQQQGQTAIVQQQSQSKLKKKRAKETKQQPKRKGTSDSVVDSRRDSIRDQNLENLAQAFAGTSSVQEETVPGLALAKD